MNLATRFSYRNATSITAGHGGGRGNLSGAGIGAALCENDLREYVPSIFAEQPHDSRSARYAYIPTINVVRGLAKEGFAPVFACEAKARDEGKLGYTKHMIRFRREGALGMPGGAALLGGCPELVMVNSHDGSTSYQLLAGFFRSLCANGMISGDLHGEIRVHHKGDVVHDVIEGAYTVVESFAKVIDSAAGMAATKLSRDQSMAYAGAALALKYYDDEKKEVVAPIVPQALLMPRRHEDGNDDLWTTFNVVQENMIRGGLRGRTVDANGRRRRSTTRAVAGIDGNVKLNRALWTLTEQMQKLASVALAA